MCFFLSTNGYKKLMVVGGSKRLFLHPYVFARQRVKEVSRISWPIFASFFTKMSSGPVDKLDTSELQSILTPELLTVALPFQREGYDIRIVGGAVRDILLGIKPKDVDLGTNATPLEMTELFKKNDIHYIETGLQHGTLTVHVNKQDFEVTTLRIDAETDGRHAKVQFTNDWKLDAERRDLTINAMSLGLDGSLYDYFGGRNDLLGRRVKFVGDPKLRIEEDYLRILRYFRFYGRVAVNENDHDQKTLNVIQECSVGLKKIAVERVWMEFSKILTGNYTPSLVRLMYKLNVSHSIGLPSFSEERMQELTRAWKEHKVHSLRPETLLCSLVKTTEEAEKLTEQWKLSNAEKAIGKFTTEHRKPKEKEHSLKPYQDMLVSVPSAQMKNLLKSHIVELLHYQGQHELAEQINTWNIPVFPITGGHLKKLGLKPGPEFGKRLGKLKELWKDSYFTISEEDLLDKAKSMLKDG
ncbi:CCA tRNA nucleotidyltransferase 1, mitochondrial-like [Montipora capricornis]|uniref:CCA tRNA nucleotidyltransferase 1, mitochondrial-like n=1 Tax=Montipora capricornis TaxID=246305 RepID=UPI0035F12ED6